jgi:hypothetical protein
LRNGGFLAHRSRQGAKIRQKSAAEKIVRDIRRAIRKQYLLETGDHREAVAAFREKRQPVYRDQ